MDNEKCVIPRCREPAHITYIEKRLCNHHWNVLCAADLGSEGEARLLKDIGLYRDGAGEVLPQPTTQQEQTL